MSSSESAQSHQNLRCSLNLAWDLNATLIWVARHYGGLEDFFARRGSYIRHLSAVCASDSLMYIFVCIYVYVYICVYILSNNRNLTVLTSVFGTPQF